MYILYEQNKLWKNIVERLAAGLKQKVVFVEYCLWQFTSGYLKLYWHAKTNTISNMK